MEYLFLFILKNSHVINMSVLTIFYCHPPTDALLQQNILEFCFYWLKVSVRTK